MGISTGAARNVRFNTATTTSYTVPNDTNVISIYNAGATNPVEFSFQDDEAGDFRTVEPKTSTSDIMVKGGQVLNFEDNSNATDIEVTAWAQ